MIVENEMEDLISVPTQPAETEKKSKKRKKKNENEDESDVKKRTTEEGQHKSPIYPLSNDVETQPAETEKKSKKRKKKNEDEDESDLKKRTTEGGQHKSPIYPLSNDVLDFSNIHVGDVIKGTINAYNVNDASLAVSKFINGCVPLVHLSDTQMNLEKKHSIGEIVTTRVLKVAPGSKQVILTCKKQLIESKHEIITEYKSNNKDKVTEGCIIKILPLGLLISFYNDVKGFAPKGLVTKEPNDDLKDLFFEGMVVKCQIVKVSEKDKNMTLSLLIAGDESKGHNILKKEREELKLRSLVSCTVEDVGETLIKVRIQPAAINAFLPVIDLSDDPNKCEIIKNQLQKGDKIHNAIVFRKDDLSVYLTLKHSVYCWLHDSCPKVLERKDLVKGKCYPAVVIKKKYPYSLLVSIPVGKIGVETLILASQLDKLNYKVGQFMIVMCTGYINSCPVLLPCKRETSPSVMQSSVHLLYGHFRDEEFVQRGWQRHGGSAEQLAQMKVGDSVDGLITAVRPYGMLLKLGKDELTGVLSLPHQGPYSKAKIGDRVSVCVLHVNYQEKCLEVSANSKLVNKVQIRDEPAVKVGQIVKCTVALSKENFILVVLETARTVAYIVSMKNTVGCKWAPHAFKVGAQHHVLIKYVVGSLVLGILSGYEEDKSIESISQAPNIIFSKSARNEVEINGKLEEDHNSINAIGKLRRVVSDDTNARTRLNDPDFKAHVAQIKVGDILEGLITDVSRPMQLILGKDEVIGVLHLKHQGPYSNAKIGDKVSVCVLHVNYLDKCLEVSANKKIINKVQIRDEPDVKVGQIVKCTVALAKEKFILVVLETARTIAYIVSKKNTVGCTLGPHAFEVGAELHVLIKYVAGSLVLGVLSYNEKDKSTKSISQAPNIFSKSARKNKVKDHNTDFALEQLKRLVLDYKHASK